MLIPKMYTAILCHAGKVVRLTDEHWLEASTVIPVVLIILTQKRTQLGGVVCQR